MGSYDSLSHAKLSLMYHIVLATRYRRRCLFGIEDSVLRSVRASLSKYRIVVLDAAVDSGDHLHLVVRIKDPMLSVGFVVSRIKQQSTYELWREHRDVLSRFYRGREHKLWSKGYFCATVGHDDECVREYVR